MPKFIIGLGNPTDAYRDTRHNIGFMAVDRLNEAICGGAPFSEKFNSAFVKYRNGDDDFVLVKPLSYMNVSGAVVQNWVSFYKADPADDVIVIFDDVDLPFGTLRIRVGGGSGGHNGIKSLIQHLGTPDFTRLRIGIGRPENSRIDLADFVLSKFSSSERQFLDERFKDVVSAVRLILDGDTAKAMNLHN